MNQSDTQPPTPTAAAKALSAMNIVLRSVLVALLSVMTILITYQVVMRYIFVQPSAISEDLLRYSLIWFGTLSAAYCFINHLHLSLPLVVDMLPPRWAERINIFNQILGLLFGVLMTYGGYFAVHDNWLTTTPMLRVSVGLLHIVLIIAGVVIVIHQAAELIGFIRRGHAATFVGVAVFVIALAAAFLAFRQTATYENLVYNRLELTSFLLLFGAFFVLLILSTPIALGLALAGILTLSLQIEFGSLFSTMGEKLFNALDTFGFLALPFFVLAGNIMNQAGIARRLIDFAMLFGRRIPGSLWQTNCIANMLFGCLSGSGIAAATAIGGIVGPVAREQKYDMAFTTAVNAASSPTGMLIPPSGTLIVYSIITGGSASIVALFLAGYIPGIIMGLAVMVWAYFYAKKRNYPVDKAPLAKGELASVLGRAVTSLFLVVVVIGGILCGIFTATEASGVAVVYSLLLALTYRKLTWSMIHSCLVQTIASSGVILFLISCSSLMSWSMTFASIPDTLAEFLTSVSSDKYVLLVIINITLLIVGVFMDMAPAQLIFTPMLYPIVTNLGVDPVHFGIIMTYNLCMGVVTPPVGTVLFVSCSMTGEKITTVSRKLLPIFFLQIVGLILVTYVPAVTLTLPRLFGL